MKFDIITIFPEIFSCFLKESLILKGINKKAIEIDIHNLRDFSKNKHKKVDDRPFGGGLGMVMGIEPIYRAISSIKNKRSKKIRKTKTILFTPRGKKFTQSLAFNLSKNDNLILICGRYEGVDERVAKKLADMEISIGDYVLMGGELPAMIFIETVSRLVPNVVGKESFLKERALKNGGFIEYPQYTRPEVFSPQKGANWKVPKVLLSGNHKKIEEWKKKHRKVIE